LPSDSDSSLVKDGTPEEMDVDVEVIDAVDEAIAAIKSTRIENQRWIIHH
jgi:hypothetical protein